MEKIGIAEFYRRFSDGYEFVFCDDDQQQSENSLGINSFVFIFDKLYVSYKPDVMMLTNKSNCKLAIDNITDIELSALDDSSHRHTDYLASIRYSDGRQREFELCMSVVKVK